MRNLLAFDLGASSGRAILGRFDGEKLSLEEIKRFENQPVQVPGGLFWDALRLFHEMKSALTLAVHDQNIGHIDALGVDTWGVDFGLLDANGELLANPRHYRDGLTGDMPDAAFGRMSKEALYQRTGIAFMPFNTLYQLVALERAGNVAYQNASSLLFMPDLFSYFFSGEMGMEYTIASTSQLLDPHTRALSQEVLDNFALSSSIFQPMQQPGSIRGYLTSEIMEQTHAGRVPVIAVPGHDTACAVAAVPAQGESFAYVSSGTWSLLGAECKQPVVTEQALSANYTNEGGVYGTIRLLRNLMGLWIIQECKREWDKQGERFSYAQVVEQAESAPALQAFIDPDDKSFLYPGDMPEKVQTYCQKTGQAVPQSRGEIARVVYESLALKYRWSIQRQEVIAGQSYDALHIVGGGSNITLLNQMVADCLQRPVYAGPGEATAIGNLLMQAAALGDLHGLSQLREVVRRSFPPVEVMPNTQAKAQWDDAYGRFQTACGL